MIKRISAKEYHQMLRSYVGYKPTGLKCDKFLIRQCRREYRRLRQAGLNKWQTRNAIWWPLFYASMHKPEFVEGVVGEKVG